jgi:hypothetical protein
MFFPGKRHDIAKFGKRSHGNPHGRTGKTGAGKAGKTLGDSRRLYPLLQQGQESGDGDVASVS